MHEQAYTHRTKPLKDHPCRMLTACWSAGRAWLTAVLSPCRRAVTDTVSNNKVIRAADHIGWAVRTAIAAVCAFDLEAAKNDEVSARPRPACFNCHERF
jgi:hypothetical protein